jgi:hypothetical protein
MVQLLRLPSIEHRQQPPLSVPTVSISDLDASLPLQPNAADFDDSLTLLLDTNAIVIDTVNAPTNRFDSRLTTVANFDPTRSASHAMNLYGFPRLLQVDRFVDTVTLYCLLLHYKQRFCVLKFMITWFKR